jgi:hypothetical protein
MKITSPGGAPPFTIRNVTRKAGDRAKAAGGSCSPLPGDDLDKPPC